MSLSTSFRGIKIRDNLIDIGFSSTGLAAANYTYSSDGYIGGDSIISGNTFSGCIGNASSSTNLISLISGSSTLVNNNFVRGSGSPINAYIAVTSSDDQFIKDNIFDQSTTDGTVETLVTGLSARSIYHSNKNQIAYLPIPVVGGTFIADPINGKITVDGALSTVTAGFNYLTVFINTLVPRTFNISFDLNSVLPESVRVLGAKVGLYNVFVGSATLSTGTFSIEIDVQDMVSANYATGLNSILDCKNKSGTVLENISADIDTAINLAALQSATQYLTIDTVVDGNDPDNFYNSKDKVMTLGLFMYNDLSVLGGGMNWVISPVVVKFIY